MSRSSSPIPITAEERWLVLVLYLVQFTHVCDFVMIMPLGPQFMRDFGIGAGQFGIMVASYSFSAGIAGFFGALVVDRFDRKRILVVLYLGFLLGTLWCALASSYSMFVLARVLSGAFGGTLGATVYAIIGDVIPEKRRGTATGVIMSAFPSASVLGVPAAIILAEQWSWRASFWALLGLGVVTLVLSQFFLPHVVGHLGEAAENRWKDLREVMGVRNHHWAFLLGFTNMFAGFMVVPYLSPFYVSNVGITEGQLTYVYLAGGLCTFFSARFIGKLSDRLGAHRTFIRIALLAIIPMVVTTHLGQLPLLGLLLVTTPFMMLFSGRMIPAMHLITSSSLRRYRGSFLSVNTSIYQIAMGLASSFSAYLLQTGANGELLNYPLVGWISMGVILLSVFVSKKVKLIA